MHIHVVKRGDTLSSIAAMHDALPAFVAADNGLALSTPLVIGQALVVRTPKTLHTVRAGETLSSIARDYDLSVRTLLRRNFFLHGRELLREGDVLAIDYADEAPLGTLGVNAYAYRKLPDSRLQPHLYCRAAHSAEPVGRAALALSARGEQLHYDGVDALVSGPWRSLSPNLGDDGQFCV